jgi:hypothetical protein
MIARYTRLAAGAAAAALVLVPMADAASHKVKAPNGQYNGTARGKDLTMLVSAKTIQIAAFSFACDGTVGRTSLDEISLKKTKKGFRFGIKAHGSITFSDGQPDENGAVDLSGSFTPNGKTVAGVFRVRSHRCQDTGSIKWKAKR